MVAIFLLHGLGCHSWTLWPLQLYLQHRGYPRVYRIDYPVDQLKTIEESVCYVSRQMAKYARKNEPIQVIGQSMGGVIANRLHRKGWRIQKTITIGSPLHGARLIRKVDTLLHFLGLYKPPYDILKAKKKDPVPPHPCHTISMGWGWSDFDGCVYRDEAVLDERNHTHLYWADHRTIFANPRLWVTVRNQLD